METKVCSKCKRELPLDNFRWKNKSQGKKHSQCKECQSKSEKKHYRENTERQKAVRERANFQKQANVEYVEYIKQQGCVKCGEKRTWVLDFHHKNPEEKENTIAHMLKSASIETLDNEIKKCILFCANCHRDYHYLEKQIDNFTVDDYINGNY